MGKLRTNHYIRGYLKDFSRINLSVHQKTFSNSNKSQYSQLIVQIEVNFGKENNLIFIQVTT